MLDPEVVESENEQVAVVPAVSSSRGAIEIPNVAPVRLQTLDIARHIAVAPDGKRYVIGTFDDRRLKQSYTTAIYPQQNGYLTLIRLGLCEISSATPEQAAQKHIEVVQAIQQGKLNDLIKAQQQ